MSRFVRAAISSARERYGFPSPYEGGSFFTLDGRPKYPSRRVTQGLGDKTSNTGILVQGPLLEKNEFTVETVRYYRSIYPTVPIVVSTWFGSPARQLRQLELLGIHVVQSEPPSWRGPANMNLQAVSTRNGLDRVQELGCAYAVKTRSDQRMYTPHLLEKLQHLLRAFPMGEGVRLQRERIVVGSLNTFVFRMYGPSDMFMMGHVEDLMRYWPDRVSERPDVQANMDSLEGFSRARIAEVGFCTDFLEATGWHLEWTIRDSWRALGQRFIILGNDELDIYWPKYTRRARRWKTYGVRPDFEEASFLLWLKWKAGEFDAVEDVLTMDRRSIGWPRV